MNTIPPSIGLHYLPLDPLRIIYDQLYSLNASSSMPFTYMGRVGRTCKLLHITSSRFILERFIELQPNVIETIYQHYKVTQGFFFFLSKEKFRSISVSISVFSKLIKKSSPQLNFFFDYIVSNLGSHDKERVNTAVCILKLLLNENLLDEPFHAFKDNIIQRVILGFDDANNTVNDANLCLLFILKIGLITSDSPCLNSVVKQVTDLIKSNYHGFYNNTRSCKVLLMIASRLFKLKLIDKNLPDFDILIATIASYQSYASDKFFLDLFQIDQNLQEAILLKYSTTVIRAIFTQGETYHWSRVHKINNLIKLLKKILDSNPLDYSECCELILNKANPILTRYSGKTFKIFQELQYYIYLKNAYSPISWKTYRTVFQETASDDGIYA